jgi:thiol-disulfide isomerase/thioredoxin
MEKQNRMNIAHFLSDTRRWNLFLAAVLLSGVGWIVLSRVPPAASRQSTPAPGAREGFSAPDFTLDRLNGGQMTLSEMRGQVVLINIWATWCVPCRIEMPALEQAYQDYRDQGLVVLGVNATYQDSEKDIAPFIQQFGMTFPILLDRTGRVDQSYEVRGLPTSFFVDRQGMIRYVSIGAMNNAVIRSRIEELVKETP